MHASSHVPGSNAVQIATAHHAREGGSARRQPGYRPETRRLARALNRQRPTRSGPRSGSQDFPDAHPGVLTALARANRHEYSARHTCIRLRVRSLSHPRADVRSREPIRHLRGSIGQRRCRRLGYRVFIGRCDRAVAHRRHGRSRRAAPRRCDSADHAVRRTGHRRHHRARSARTPATRARRSDRAQRRTRFDIESLSARRVVDAIATACVSIP